MASQVQGYPPAAKPPTVALLRRAALAEFLARLALFLKAFLYLQICHRQQWWSTIRGQQNKEIHWHLASAALGVVPNHPPFSPYPFTLCQTPSLPGTRLHTTMAPSLPQFSAARMRSYLFRLPLFTRAIILVITILWIVSYQSLWDVKQWGSLIPDEISISTS